jgi:hypothetical protein
MTKLFLPLMLLTAHIAFGMEQFLPNDVIKKNMKVMHSACRSSSDAKPKLENFNAAKKTFIAKTTRFARTNGYGFSSYISQYYFFKTNEHVDELAKMADEGSIVEWFYYDGVARKGISPNIVIIEDGDDDN